MAKSNTNSLGQASVGKDMRVYAIGDIHGCVDELKALLKLIKADLATHPVKKHRLIFIGDYVDRGPDCKGVIDRLLKLKSKGHPVTFLRGNHEEKLMTAFSGINQRQFDGFAKYGGLETLASYGLTAEKLQLELGGKAKVFNLKAFSKAVRKYLPKKHIKFLTKLKSSTKQGDYFFCHAGVDPEVPFNKQNEFDLVWMREPFLSWDKPLERVVVHGHTPRDKPQARPHRINVDTACVYGGALTAVVLEGTTHRFLQIKAMTTYRRGN